MTKILMFAGSAQKASVNKQLIQTAADVAADEGANVTLIDLADYPMPLYDADYEKENGHPDEAIALHDLIKHNDALVIASPEYNGLFSPLLKNTIDWISRVNVDVFEGKKAAIISASPGALGGMRALPHVRALLNNLNVTVIPQQLAVGSAKKAFDEHGKLKDKNQQVNLDGIIGALLEAV